MSRGGELVAARDTSGGRLIFMWYGPKSLRLFVIAAVMVVNGFAASLLLYALDLAREQHEQEARSTTRNIALLVDQTISESALKVDLLLREIVHELESDLRREGRLDAVAVDALLSDRRQWLAELANFRATDASGEVLFGPGVDPGSSVNYADRDFFVIHRSRSDAGVIVTNPIFGRLTNGWLIAFTRRYNHPDGSFAGVVSASIPVSHFTAILSELALGPHGVALLRDSDTALITRYPASGVVSQQIGTKIFSRELSDIIASGVREQTFHVYRTGDNVERINSYRRLSAVPFHLVVGMGADDYLERWREGARKAAVVMVIFLVITAGSAWMAVQSVSLTRKASDRLRTFIDCVPQHIAVLDAEGKIVLVNNAWRNFSIANGGAGDGYIGLYYGGVCGETKEGEIGRAHV